MRIPLVRMVQKRFPIVQKPSRLAVAAVVAACATTAARAVDPFKIVVLPDTQYYSQNNVADPTRSLFHDQVNWTLANRDQHNIVFLTHLGDVVNTAGSVATPTGQWAVALDAMRPLKNSTLPFNILAGNHEWTSAAGSGSIDHYRDRFGDRSNNGAGYFAGKEWFLGYDGRGINTAVKFDTPAGPMLNLSLEFGAASPLAIPGAPPSPIAWAQSILDANPGVPTIISTHNYINPGKGRDGFANALFKQLVRDNNQVFMVLNGHYNGNDNEEDLTSLNSYGRPVFEMGSDYQNNANGGDGWMRIIEIDPDANRLRVETYSPKNNADLSGDLGGKAGATYNNVGTVRTDYDSKFERELDLSKRFKPTPAPLATQRKTFQHGANGYAGGVDTEIDQLTPNTALSSTAIIDVDGDTTDGNVSQALVKFDNLFGTGSGQVADDRDVTRATLRVYIDENVSNSQGAGLIAHRMLTAWDGNSTWASLVDGISADGIDALRVVEDSAGAGGSNQIKAGTWIELDVTRSLRAMQNGAANHGWALLPWNEAGDAIRFNANESANVSRRPQLQVDVTAQPVTTRSFKNGTNGYTSAVSTTIDGNNPTTPGNAADDIIRMDAGASDYLTPDTQALLRFDNLFGAGDAQIPAEDVQVTSAMLKLVLPADVENAPGGGFSVNRMYRSWNGQSTWNTLGDGVVINDDATSIPDDTQGIDNVGRALEPGTLYVDVTASLRAWTEGGETNFGWALLPLNKSTDAVFLNSVNAALLSARPELVVRYLSLGPATWTAPSSGEWLATASWQGGHVPDAAGRTTIFGATNAAPTTITLNAAQTVGTMRFDSANAYTIAGTGTLTLQRAAGTVAPARIDVTRGQHAIATSILLANNLELDVAANARIELLGGITPTRSVSIIKSGDGSAGLRGARAALLSVGTGQLDILAGEASVVGALSISPLGSLRVESGATLAIDYLPTAANPMTSIRSAILAGRIKAIGDDARLTVGYADPAAIGLAGFDASTLVLRSAFRGDANLDGRVDFDDLLALARSYGGSGTWSQGDATHDALVNFDDLLALAASYGQSSLVADQLAQLPQSFAADFALAQAIAPEPATILVTAATLGLSMQRRR